MLSYLLPARPGDSADESQRQRILFEQRLNSMSSKSLETHFSRSELRSGLLRFVLKRPEHKLRDLARIFLGKTEEALAQLDITQVAQLFHDRRMTFSMDQLANVTFRRYRELAVHELFDRHYDMSENKGKLLFLMHDEQGTVSLVTMQNKGDFFPCTVVPLVEGPLFEEPKEVIIILRHPNPHIMWQVNAAGEEEEGSASPALRIEENDSQNIRWNLGAELGGELPVQKGETAMKKEIEQASKMQNLPYPLGYATYSKPRSTISSDERTLLGFPKDGPQINEWLVLMDLWFAEIRGMAAQMDMGFGFSVPSAAIMERQGIKLGWVRDSGLTFSAREVALFMKNAPRLRDSEVYAMLVHNDKGEVFDVTLTYRKNRIEFGRIGYASRRREILGWNPHVIMCLRTHFSDRVWKVSSPLLTDFNGKHLLLRDS